MKQVITLAFLCVCFTMKAQTPSLIQQAIANYNYETALKLIEKEKAPTTQLLFLKAQALKGLNQPSDALTVYQDIIKSEPDNNRALIETAECNRLLGKYREALRFYEKAHQLSPSNKYVQLQQISLLCNLEQFTAAKKACNELMKNDSSVVSQRLLAQCYEGLSKTDSAIICYNMILKSAPEDYLSVARLASLHIKQNNMQSAIECTEEYRKKDTTNLFVNKQNAQAYCLAKNYTTAINRYKYLVNQGDSSYLTCYYLGICYYATEKFYDAHDFLSIALKEDPKNINLLYYMARSCAKTSWKKEGVDYMNQAIDLTIPSDTTMIRLYIGLADCYKLAGMPDNQIEALQQQYKYDRKNSKLLYQMGAIYQDVLKNDKKAEQYLEMFLKTRPKEQKEKAAVINNRGEVEMDDTAFYNAAIKRLEKIRKERFFREGVSQKELKDNENTAVKDTETRD
ncbi:tetratricopeptide repeat protein [uncultured Bacteroides sp.]|uniref:tetratricopeptide repeat protein n=1 Tax=uncultured Bacteroides sp. TaxID=162156 RepID=UPI002AA6B5BA|nr:tetratricopeptide repeat protein [uncultured Bacteroides sp.]